jgi:Bacterial conjugation TrbI-like protein/Aminotransferase class I and II
MKPLSTFSHFEASLTPRLPERGTVIRRSFGKTYGLAGLRLSFALASADFAKRLRSALGPWPVCGPAIEIGARVLADRDWLAQTTKRLQAEAAQLDARLSDTGQGSSAELRYPVWLSALMPRTDSGEWVRPAFSCAPSRRARVGCASASHIIRRIGRGLKRPDSLQNMQDRKVAFLNASVDRRTVSPDHLQHAASRYVVQVGSVIPAALITGIRSDLPGQVTAQVTENVYDTPTGNIPQARNSLVNTAARSHSGRIACSLFGHA